MTEKAIALQDTQPRRNQLRDWYEIISINHPAWEEKARAYGSLVGEAIKHGIATVKALLNGWPEDLRWGAIMSMEEQSPEAMLKLMQIEPNWSDLCVEW